MDFEVLDTADAVARRAAALIAADARDAVAARGLFNMAVSGGHTPWVMLGTLADEHVHGTKYTSSRSTSVLRPPEIRIAI